MMLEYILISDDPIKRVYKVVSDNDIGTITINKEKESAVSEGSFSSMFSSHFIENLAIETLKFKTNPPKNFVYGVG